MPQQELDLFQVAAGLPAELRAGTTQVVGAEVLDADLLRSFRDDRPDRPVAQALPDFAALGDGPQQRTLLDRTGLPGINSLLHPDRNRHRPDPAALADQIDDHPAVLPHLDVLDSEGGQFPSP